MGFADLHIHSAYSHDATVTVRAILKQAADVGLDVIAVTDHDEIRGSLEARDLAPKYGIESIPAAEVSTSQGHLLALFIETLPPAGMSLVETLLHIGRQGGVAIAAHPFNQFAVSLSVAAVVGALANPRAKGVLKGLETHNTSTKAFNGVVQKLAVHLPLAKIASSDAHNYWGIGAGRTEFPGETAQELRKALDQMTTAPVPYEGDFSAKEILGWGRRLALKTLGYASDSKSATQPINTQPMSKSFIQRTKKKK